MNDYIKWLREKVGKELIIINYVTACITDESGNILLQKRSKDIDLWGFPGGIIEKKESASEAIIREVKEETGFNIKIDYLIGIYTKYFSKFENGDESQTICHFFKCSIINGKKFIDNKETFDLKFFTKLNIPKLFCKVHEDKMNDYLNNCKGIIR